MNLSDLLKEELIKKVDPDKATAKLCLESAEKDIIAASDNLEKHPSWALAMAYNSMLNSGRALMLLMGYRPSETPYHLAVVKFCSVVLAGSSSDLTVLFNRYRIKRHEVMYDGYDMVGVDEAKSVVNNARNFLQAIKARIREKNL